MPPLQKVTADPKTTALLVMDFMKTSCTEQARPRCVASVAPVKKLLDEARAKGVTVIYTVAGNDATMTNFLPDLAAKAGEPIIGARADKFLNPELDKTSEGEGRQNRDPGRHRGERRGALHGERRGLSQLRRARSDRRHVGLVLPFRSRSRPGSSSTVRGWPTA